MQRFLFDESHLDVFIDKIQEVVTKELQEKYGNSFEIGEYGLPNVLEQIYAQAGKGFIFIIDEWDCVFRIAKERKEVLKVYIDMDFNGLKEAIIEMLSNVRCKINTRKFQNDMTTFKTRDDVLTLLVQLGYLAYDEGTGEAFIPNQEIAEEFLDVVDDEGWNGQM
jgi:hypothetical protein